MSSWGSPRRRRGRSWASSPREPPAICPTWRSPAEPATTYLVGQSGASVSVCEPEAGRAWEHQAVGLHEAAEGRIDDCLRRALGLPTRRCPAGVAELWARMWLDDLAATACADPAQHWSWPDAAARHPAARFVVDHRPGWQAEVAGALLQLGDVLTGAGSWAELRVACAAGSWSTDLLSPAVAGWMDDAMFARWLLADLPDCGELVAMLRDLVPPTVVGSVEASLRAWGVEVTPGTTGGPPATGDDP